MNAQSMKPRKLDSLRYGIFDLDFSWRREFDARVTFAKGEV